MSHSKTKLGKTEALSLLEFSWETIFDALAQKMKKKRGWGIV